MASKSKSKKKAQQAQPEAIQQSGPEYIKKKNQQQARTIQHKIQSQLENGNLKISKKVAHVQKKQSSNGQSQNPQTSIRDKINNLNHDLEELHKQIALKKEEERQIQKYKRKQAAMLIERLKKEKEQHHNRIKSNQMNIRLKNSLFSEQIVQIMQQRRERLLLEKKKQLQQRIQKNINRRSQRQEGQAKNEQHYWTKVKELQEKKRSKSTKILPSIHKINQQPQFGVNLSGLQKIDKLKNRKDLHKRSFSKQDIRMGGANGGYQQIVKKFIQRTRARQLQIKSQNQKSQLQSNKIELEISPYHPRANQLKNDSFVPQQIPIIYENKFKLFGNAYLKEMNEKSVINKSRIKNVNTSQQNSMLEESLELKGNQASFSKNNKITNLEERRNKILQNLLDRKIDKQRVIQYLGPIQNKLDKINPEGIEKRLKHKLQIFQQCQPKNEQKLALRKIHYETQRQQQEQQIKQSIGSQQQKNQFLV